MCFPSFNMLRRKGIRVILAGLLLALPAAAAGAESLEVPLEFSRADLWIDTVRGFDRLDFEGASQLAEAGSPALPVVQVRVAIPEGVSLGDLAARIGRVEALPGSFSVIPAQPPLPTNGTPGEWVAPDAAVYGAAGPFPAEPVRLLGQTDLAGQAMAVIEVCPLRYYPAQGRLELIAELSLAIETVPGGDRGDYLPARATAAEREELSARVREMVVNPEAVALREGARGDSRIQLEAGDYDYVIITSSDLEPSLQALAEWKTKKGVPARTVTTTWIYGQYSGTNDAKIRAFIGDAHQQWGAVYFLLGGDVNKVPANLWSTSIDPYNVTNDTYYADYDGDWTIEVHVGRATGSYGLYQELFTSKVLAYEKTPPLTGYAMQAGLLGFDLDEESPGEVCKNYVENNYWPSGWEVTHVYDSQEGDHKQAVVDLIESGVNLVNHIDHCDVTMIGVGSSHDWWLTELEIDGLTNAEDQTIWYSTGCNAAAFDLSCIAEEFCKSFNGGLIAYVGNSEFGWYNPGACNTLSNLYDRLFFQTLFLYNQTNLGACFSEHKNRHFPANETERYIVRELTLLGDPELPIWTADPMTMAVTHPASFGEGTTSFTVHVTGAGDLPLAGARVCLMKDDEIYLVGLTNASGNATFDPSAGTLGTMDVTVTARNYLPVEQTCEITEGGSAAEEPALARSFALHAGWPNPFQESAAIGFELPAETAATLKIYDLSGRAVRTLLEGARLAGGPQRAIWDGRDALGQPVAAGVYLCRLEAGRERAVRQLILVR